MSGYPPNSARVSTCRACASVTAKLHGLDGQLQRIAEQVSVKYGDWRVEAEDMLQEARVGAWEALERAQRKRLPVADHRAYALGAARKQCERTAKRLRSGAFDSFDTFSDGPEKGACACP